MRRRLRYPLTTTVLREALCAHRLDSFGDRAAACPRFGRLRLRARPIEQMSIWILREAGERLREKLYLRYTALPTSGGVCGLTKWVNIPTVRCVCDNPHGG